MAFNNQAPQGNPLRTINVYNDGYIVHDQNGNITRSSNRFICQMMGLPMIGNVNPAQGIGGVNADCLSIREEVL